MSKLCSVLSACIVLPAIIHLALSSEGDDIPLLTLKAPIATKVVCFSRLLKCLRNLYANSVDPGQTAPIGAVCSGSTLFASVLNLPVMLGNYL